MSLLIKALEQAAKDRDSAKAAGTAASSGSAPAAEPTLEPPPPSRPVPSLDAAPRERSTTTPAEVPDFARGTPSLDPAPAARAPAVEPPPPARVRPTFDADEAKVAAAATAATAKPGLRPTSAPGMGARAGASQPGASPVLRRPATPSAPGKAPPLAGASSGLSAAPAPGPASAAPATKASRSAASLDEIDAQDQRARAATVMQASGGAAGNAVTYLRSNPIAAVGALALLCGVGYGVYVYLQISNPSLFVRQAAKQPDQVTAAPPPPQPTAPPPQSAVAPVPDALPPAAPAAAAVAAEVSPQSPPGTTGAIAASSVIGSSPRLPETTSPRIPETSSPRIPETPAPRAAAQPERLAEAPRERGSITPNLDAPKAAPATPRNAASAEAGAAPRERIAVNAAAAQPRMNPALGDAYSSLQTGNLDAARTQYSRVLQAEPQNVDAMLGLAYIAAQENRADDAMRFYTRILQLNPRHPQAQAAMIGLVGRADPVASETRLKQLIAREPSAFLHFVLGNVYADQSLWAQAQQSYFQAHHLEPSNPDYAYNLAVGLDHLGQRKLALNFYRLAAQLASGSGRANFSVTHAQERIGALSAQLD